MSSLQDWIAGDIPEAITEDAARWMARLDAECCTEADRLAFARWLDEDPQHRWAFQELSEVWARLRTLADVKPLLEQPVVHRLPSARPAALVAAATGKTAAPRRELSTLVASLLVILGFVAHLALDAPTQRFATGTGEVRSVMLADGSRVELNAQTQLEVDIDRDGRRVRLLQGDAVFHVARDSRPFVVSTDRGSVAALGTAFAVQRGDDATQVAVLTGRVAVTLASAELPLTPYDGAVDFTPRPERAVLGSGERLEVAAELRPRSASSDELARDLSWRQGYLVYDQAPLGSVISDMRRYSDVNIHLADARLDEVRVSGRFATGDVEALLAQLSADAGLRVDRGGPHWVVLRRGPAPPDKNS